MASFREVRRGAGNFRSRDDGTLKKILQVCKVTHISGQLGSLLCMYFCKGHTDLCWSVPKWGSNLKHIPCDTSLDKGIDNKSEVHNESHIGHDCEPEAQTQLQVGKGHA
jgi:hypothetical protein